MSLFESGSYHINPVSGEREIFVNFLLWSQLSIIDVISFCARMICFSNGISSIVASQMKVCSGIMVTSWLSSLPWSALGGLDSKSATTWLLPGICLILKL